MAHQQGILDAALHTALLAAYPLTPPVTAFVLPSGVNNHIIGLHTGAGDFALKTLMVLPDPSRLAAEIALLNWLQTQALSFRVPAPLPTHQGEWLLNTPWGKHLLLPLLPGRPPDHTQVDEIEAVGTALGELHLGLARYPFPALPGYTPYRALEQVHPQLPNPYALTPTQVGLSTSTENERLFAWLRSELVALRTWIDTAYDQLPQQLIHSDYAPSNTLYAAGRITAVLDFEFAGLDVRAMDVAAGLVFSMRLWENPQPLPYAAAFARGYGHHHRLTPAEITAIPWLIRLRNAVSTIWWLGRNLAAGTQPIQLNRLGEMRQWVEWLATAEPALQAILWEQLA
ncbi:MAG: phosphotransferase [Caldilineaceae bacterium]|nr:phosphotransferase [Caldilineaceae bacterium]